MFACKIYTPYDAYMSLNHLVHGDSGNYSSEDAPKLHGSWNRNLEEGNSTKDHRCIICRLANIWHV